MKLVTPSCPKCGSPAHGTVENILGTAVINIEDDGTFEYAGDTDMHWDTQETITNEKGHITLTCGQGCPDWVSGVICEEGETAPAPKKAAAQLVMLDQPVYARVMGKAIRIRMVIAGTPDSRVDEANKQFRANPDLSVLTDTGSVTYLADKSDLGVPVTKMEIFRT
jgi:hypothetical protein